MKNAVIIAKCDVCGIKYAAVEDERQVARTGVYETKIEYHCHCASNNNEKGFDVIGFGDCCKECREKILNDFIALGEKYTKRSIERE